MERKYSYLVQVSIALIQNANYTIAVLMLRKRTLLQVI